MSDVYNAPHLGYIHTFDPNITVYGGSNALLYQICVSFAFGLFLSPFNRGIIWLIIISILLEFNYANYINFEYNTERLFVRFGLFCSSLLGYFIGRILFVNDDQPLVGR